MAGALMGCVLRASCCLLRTVDARHGIALEWNGRSLALRESLLCGPELGCDSALFMHIPAPREHQARTRRNQKKDLWHGSKPKARPKRARLDRRDEVGGETAG